MNTSTGQAASDAEPFAAPFVIVGGGVAAARAAEAFRAVSDAPLTIVADEHHLPYHRPPLSKGYLAGRKGAEGDLLVFEPDWYAEHHVSVLTGRTVAAVDLARRSVTLDDGSQLDYDGLLLATGARPRPLPAPGAGRVLYLRSWSQSDALRAALRDAAGAGAPVVLAGGNWIGMEVAAVARELGAQVTVVTPETEPLSRAYGDEVGRWFRRLHEAHGVTVLGGRLVTEVTGRGGRFRDVTGVVLDDGTRLPAGLVVAGVGMVRNTVLAEDAGLEASAGGVIADSTLRTADPHVWVAGDVALAHSEWAGAPLSTGHWATAYDQGAVAGRNMALSAAGASGEPARYDFLPFFYSDQYDTGLESYGLADASSARLTLRGSLADDHFAAAWTDAEGRVAQAMHVNSWDDSEALKALVLDHVVLDPVRFADPGTPLAESAVQYSA